MVLPNFLLVGAARSGSTYLYHALRQHPDVFLPERKELQYFSNTVTENNGIVDINDYARHFAPASGQTAIGEMSPDYLYAESAAQWIAQHLPRVKLLVILRNPTTRAYSHYWHNIRKSYEHIRKRKETLTFEEAIRCEPERLAAGSHNDRLFYSYVDRGFYLRQIERYAACFPRDQMHIVLMDTLKASPQNALNGICEFLGIAHFTPQREPDTHHAVIPKYPSLHRALTRARIGLADAKLTPAAQLLKSIINALPRTADHPPMKPETQAHLRGVYQDSNVALFDFLGIANPPNWN
jgi:hypothetical protein